MLSTLVISALDSSLSGSIITALIHWGRLTHIHVGTLTSIGSDNGFSPGRCQATIWTNAGILSIGTLGTNCHELNNRTKHLHINTIPVKSQHSTLIALHSLKHTHNGEHTSYPLLNKVILWVLAWYMFSLATAVCQVITLSSEGASRAQSVNFYAPLHSIYPFQVVLHTLYFLS